jgi:glycosyltransferase involved in cell wall biosynthesis
MPVIARLADAMLFNGRALLEVHRDATPLTIPHASYLPPVDLARYAPDAERRERARAELGIATGDVLIGAVANLNPDKGLEYLIRAAALVTSADPRARFIVAGSRYSNHAAYAAALDDQRRAAGLDDRLFRFVGPRADPEAIYAALDVKVVSSISEGTTTTALEAMASGVAVVATDVGAVREVVLDGATGLLVPSRDAGALATAILRVGHDAKMRARFGAAGRERALARFGVAGCADIHLRMFHAALAHRDRRLSRRT